MQEKTLIIIAIICIVIGLPGLYLASQFVQIDDPRILSSITGKVVSINEKEKITIINVKMDNTLPVVIFEKTNAKKGDNILVKGELQTYKEKLEFVADKIERR